MSLIKGLLSTEGITLDIFVPIEDLTEELNAMGYSRIKETYEGNKFEVLYKHNSLDSLKYLGDIHEGRFELVFYRDDSLTDNLDM